MKLTVKPGLMFLKPTPPNDSHYFFVVVGPDENNNFLCVNITEFKNLDYEDNSCVFLGNEHEKITKPSRIAYEFAVKLKDIVIVNEINNGNFKFIDYISESLYKKVQTGLKNTEALKTDFEYFIELLP